jgi:hypothetical protein
MISHFTSRACVGAEGFPLPWPRLQTTLTTTSFETFLVGYRLLMMAVMLVWSRWLANVMISVMVFRASGKGRSRMHDCRLCRRDLTLYFSLFCGSSRRCGRYQREWVAIEVIGLAVLQFCQGMVEIDSTSCWVFMISTLSDVFPL